MDRIVWNIIPIRLGSEELWPECFQYGCTVTLIMEIWPWVKVMTHPLVIDNKCVCNIIQIKLGSEELWPGHRFLVYVHCDLDLQDMILGQVNDTPLGHGELLCEILSRSNLAVRSYGPDTDFQVCVHWDLDLGDMTLGLGHDTPLVKDNNCVWNIIQIRLGSEKLWPGHGFPVCVYCDLDLGDLTLGQGHDTPFGHGQQLCEIISWSNLAVRSYGPDTDFQYVCTVTLTLEIWPWVKVMTHSLVTDNNCVKLYPDRTREYKVMARTQCKQMDRQTDRQTDRVIPICLRVV